MIIQFELPERDENRLKTGRMITKTTTASDKLTEQQVMNAIRFGQPDAVNIRVVK